MSNNVLYTSYDLLGVGIIVTCITLTVGIAYAYSSFQADLVSLCSYKAVHTMVMHFLCLFCSFRAVRRSAPLKPMLHSWRIPHPIGKWY